MRRTKSKAVGEMLQARDIYPSWQTRIRAAEKSITVFSPFLDDLLVRLLADAGRIEPSNILVVTDFKNAAFLEHPAQLLAIRALLDSGVSVKSLPLLHAKVLLTDNEHVVLGSQNFTGQGRKNKEASFVSEAAARSSRFLRTLLEWADTAEPVDEDLVDRLLECIAPLANRFKKTKAELEFELDAIIAEQERLKAAEHRRRLDDQVKRSTIRLACGEAFARIKKHTCPVRSCRRFRTRRGMVLREGVDVRWVDYDRFKRFQVSIVWRACIAGGNAFKHIQASADMVERMRLALFNGNLDENLVPCAMEFLEAPDGANLGFFSFPVAKDNIICFVMGGYKWHFYMDGNAPSEIVLRKNGYVLVKVSDIDCFYTPDDMLEKQ